MTAITYTNLWDKLMKEKKLELKKNNRNDQTKHV